MKYILAICIATSVLFSQSMRDNAKQSLFSDYKATQLGDAITILVVESSQASNNAETSSGRTSDLGFDFSGGTSTADLSSGSVSLGSKNKFSGSGSTKSTGVIKTKISATIDSVLKNGNLMIKGSRKLVINGEEQIISIKGVVRPIDITSDNTVLSTSISDAEIRFEGNGMINDSQKPGWFTRILHWLF